jgi:hypothetical protein
MPLWLLTGLGAVRKALAGLFALACKYPWQSACIALLLFGGWEWRGKHAAEARLGACESGRKADRLSYTQAQQEALRRALAAKAAQEAHYKELANETDRKAAVAAVDANARAAEYVRAHRVRDKAAPGSSSGPAASPNGGGAQGADGPGGEAELVTVTPADVQVCTDNTTRLQAARDWALSLGKP